MAPLKLTRHGNGYGTVSTLKQHTMKSASNIKIDKAMINCEMYVKADDLFQITFIGDNFTNKQYKVHS